MNLVIEFQDEGGENREALNVDKRGRYYIDSKRVTLPQAFRWYARRTARPSMSSSSGSFHREGRFLKRVAALLKN